MSDTDNRAPLSPDTPAAGRSSAVAIRYDTQEEAPRVVAKGYGNIADTIIRTAQENNLYVHESPELVNLLMQVDLDSQIPPQLYVAIAELLAWIYNLEERTVALPAETTAAEAAANPGD
ncbi:MAG: flagellar biosynthesis protein FlhB [Alcaligenaceae bacterium]|nr:flagellar biosynthesis protein FlhB [Alcaligenaceae bacterium]